MKNPSSPTVTRIAILPLLTTASRGVGTSGVFRNRNLGPQSTGIKTATGSSDKDREKNRDRECDRSKKGDIRHGSERPSEHSP